MKPFLQTCRALAAMLTLVVLSATPALAAPPQAELAPQDTLMLQRVAAYLNNIHTMTARFSQVTGTGARSSGEMYIERPGRMRFDYDPPSAITLIADTFYVYYWDKQLHQVQKVSLKSTPAWFFLRDPINFGADSIVTSFANDGNTVRIGVVERADPDSGSLTMVFTENPIALAQWTVVDQQRNVTTVTLSDLQYGMALDPKLFQYRDPLARTLREN
ncbi:MAG TPA: outer membrane lipoprotein carrier protein LolA [Stellaceae bacterium]|nr:outer membrane lipoprotein carrier protein LolA [Stellaceae bacterium]